MRQLLNKKYLLVLLTITCFLCSCGKTNVEDVEEVHNYAVNEIKSNMEETESTEEDLYIEESTDVYEETVISVEIDGNSFIYPIPKYETILINNMPIANIIDNRFKLYNIEANLDDCKETSSISRIYEPTSILKLSNTRYDGTDTYSLSQFVPTIDKITIGQYQYTADELFVPIEKLNKLLELFDTNYSSLNEIYYNDIFNSAYTTYENDHWGNTYEWKFSINNESLEYTEEELFNIYNKYGINENEPYIIENEDGTVSTIEVNNSLNDEITVTAVCNGIDDVISYTVDISKLAHFWVDDTNNIYQGGFDYSYSNIKLIDESYIGLKGLSYTIYNPNLNRNLNIDF